MESLLLKLEMLVLIKIDYARYSRPDKEFNPLLHLVDSLGVTGLVADLVLIARVTGASNVCLIIVSRLDTALVNNRGLANNDAGHDVVATFAAPRHGDQELQERREHEAAEDEEQHHVHEDEAV